MRTYIVIVVGYLGANYLFICLPWIPLIRYGVEQLDILVDIISYSVTILIQNVPTNT